MISPAGLARRITLAGEWPPQSVGRAYRAADAFALPSCLEGYGMAYRGSDGAWLAGDCDDRGRDTRDGAAAGRAVGFAG